jgi:glycine/D-amino acid oxidase-like deaminating enzyme
VVLCEKGKIGAEQSGRNWGWTRVMGRDPREIPLGIESLKLWRRMNEITGAETGFRQSGIVYLCDTADDVAKYEEWLEQARPFQLDSRLLAPHEIEAVLSGSARPWAGGLHTPSDGRAESTKAAPAIAEAARRRGATVLTGCAVRGVETKAGRVASVVTERGRASFLSPKRAISTKVSAPPAHPTATTATPRRVDISPCRAGEGRLVP